MLTMTSINKKNYTKKIRKADKRSGCLRSCFISCWFKTKLNFRGNWVEVKVSILFLMDIGLKQFLFLNCKYFINSLNFYSTLFPHFSLLKSFDYYVFLPHFTSFFSSFAFSLANLTLSSTIFNGVL